MRLWIVALPLLAGVGLAAGFLLRRGEPVAEASALAVAPSVAPAKSAIVRYIKARGQLGPGRGTLVIGLEPPPASKLTVGAPLAVEARGEHLKFPESIKRPLDPKALPIRLPIDVADGALGPAHIKLSFYWCVDGNAAACRPERVELVTDLDLSGDAPGGEAFVAYRVTP